MNYFKRLCRCRITVPVEVGQRHLQCLSFADDSLAEKGLEPMWGDCLASLGAMDNQKGRMRKRDRMVRDSA